MQADADQPVAQPGRAERGDLGGHRPCLRGQFAVRQGAGPAQYGGPLGVPGRLCEERLVQQARGTLTARVVGAGTAGELMPGQLHDDLLGPHRVVVGEPGDQRGVGGEHVVEQALREELLHTVPGQVEGAGEVHHLVVQPDLRGLAHPVGDVAEVAQRPGDVRGGAEAAGEDHGHRLEAALEPQPAPFAQRLQSADLPVAQIVLELRLGGLDPLGERTARRGVGLQQADGGEVADHAPQMGMDRAPAAAGVGEQQRQPVEQGEIEGEPAGAAPDREHLGEQGREDGGRGQPPLLATPLQDTPLVLGQMELAVGEARPVHAHRRLGQGEFGRRGEGGGPGGPVG
ncbi:hypothetical protein, partial [Streptomyces sp. SID685]|uniref:hypothetical protein n=1 Tax=Streptomyces sp. SID685 TaxID=2690322 RepID=UPI001926B39C